MSLRSAAVLLVFLLTGCKAPGPLVAGDFWSGSYACAQGSTRLVLRIVSAEGDAVHAVFDFEHRESGASGQFELAGTYHSQSHRLVFEPGE